MGAKQKRIEALEEAARAAQSQHQTDLTELHQQTRPLQQEVTSLQRHSDSLQAVSTRTSTSTQAKAKKPLMLQQQDPGQQLSVSSLQELLYGAQCQLAEQAEQIARLQQEASVTDTQLEKLSNLLQPQEAHAQRLEVQLDSKADAAKSRFAKVSSWGLHEMIVICTIGFLPGFEQVVASKTTGARLAAWQLPLTGNLSVV